MTLAQQLYEISATRSERKSDEFEARINGHPEEKLLRECLDTAKCGRTQISLGRNCLPPYSLNKEGFKLRADGPGFVYCWD